MYGAGSIGRGFIGPLFAKAGYEVVFIDVNRAIVDALNQRRSYHYTIAADPPRDIPVSGVRGVDGRDERAVIDEIASCDLMAVSLGASVLQLVAPLIAKGFSKRMRQSGKPLNLLICENLKDAAHLLEGWLRDALPPTEEALIRENCGLIEAAIGRMVPVTPPHVDDPLHVTVEAYAFLPVDRAAFVGEPPEIEGLIPYAPFAFYEERKLYLHNMGHAICAYLGMREGHETIASAIAVPGIRLLVQSAMTESAAMLSVKFGVPFTRIFDHAEDLLLRFSNRALGDTCERVGRDPLRKIAAGDRLAGALAQCREHGVYPAYIALGYAAALAHVTDNAEEMAQIAKEVGALPEDQIALVMRLRETLDFPAEALLETVGQIKKELRGDIV